LHAILKFPTVIPCSCKKESDGISPCSTDFSTLSDTCEANAVFSELLVKSSFR